MTEHNAVAAEQDAKSSRKEADLTGNHSDILAFVFCRTITQRAWKYIRGGGTMPHRVYVNYGYEDPTHLF